MASERSEMNYTYTLPSSKLPTSFTTRAGADDYMEPARLTKCIPPLLQVMAIPLPAPTTDETTPLEVVCSLDLIMIVGLLVQGTWETLNSYTNISTFALLTKSCSKAGSHFFSLIQN